MRTAAKGFGYNERLFSGGLRGRLHFARFCWFERQVTRRGITVDRLLELGCFDGKLLDFLPKKPSFYIGYDANWEGGLEIARKRWAGNTHYHFIESATPAGMQLADTDRFDVAVSMETLEHIPPELVDPYLAKLARHTDGHLFVTIPNEKGILFLAKWLYKWVRTRDTKGYTFSEVVNATMGRMSRVARDQHKGFDYVMMIQQIAKHFEIVEVSGIPSGVLPHLLCFGIGVVARPLRR